jgi:ATP-dependent 26S proteasome regulatory subunit
MSQEMDYQKLNMGLLELMQNQQSAVGDRADSFIFNVCERGLDFRPAVETLIAEADVGRKLAKELKTQQMSPLVSERFVGTVEKPRFCAVVTRGQGTIYLPADSEQIRGLKRGDSVLIDLKADRIVARDGQLPPTGDVVTVDSLPPDKPDQIVVKHHDQAQLAWLHHDLLDRLDECRPGTRVLYEPSRRFVLGVVDTRSDGGELLAALDKLGSVRRENVGSPKPVADEIIERVVQFVDHPDWVQAMHARPRCSYLFVGGTGTGKSFTLKLIAEELHALVEEKTGQRTSRMVICDASQFWASLFGETEQRIAAWAEKLQNLGARPLVGLDGRILRFPLIVVLEECEALLRIRGDQTGSGHLFDRPLSLLLQKTESLEAALQIPIIWVATSNRADLADPAALRRLGMRRENFGNLNFDEAASVLFTKLPDDLPIYDADGDAPGNRDAVIRKVLGYLYGSSPRQALAEVRLANSRRRTLNRSALVTPAALEEAVSAAIDDCLRRSHRAGRLLGLDARDLIRFLESHYCGLARSLTRHNLPAHCPEWFEDEPLEVADVTSLVGRGRRAVAVLD